MAIEKKEAARILFLEGTEQNDIARILGVSEQTVSKWQQAGDWKGRRARNAMRNQEIESLANDIALYQLEALQRRCERLRKESDEDEDLPLIERNEIGSVKDILATIKERQMGYGLIVRLLNDFTKWVGEHDINTAKRLAEIGPDYLEAKRQQL